MITPLKSLTNLRTLDSDFAASIDIHSFFRFLICFTKVRQTDETAGRQTFVEALQKFICLEGIPLSFRS